jgi:hypothetical protein
LTFCTELENPHLLICPLGKSTVGRVTACACVSALVASDVDQKRYARTPSAYATEANVVNPMQLAYTNLACMLT